MPNTEGEWQQEDIPEFFQNCKPPAPPGQEDLWELQFCRWWGWNWVRKRKEHQKQVPIAPETSRRSQSPPKTKTNYFQNVRKCLRCKTLTVPSPSLLKLYCTPSNSLVRLRDATPCELIRGNASKARRASPGGRSMDVQCWTTTPMEDSDDSSSDECIGSLRPKKQRSSTEESVEYLKIRCCTHRPQKNKSRKFSNRSSAQKCGKCCNTCSTQTCGKRCTCIATQTKAGKEHRHRKKRVCLVCCSCAQKYDISPCQHNCYAVERPEKLPKAPDVGTQWSDHCGKENQSKPDIGQGECGIIDVKIAAKSKKTTENPEEPVKDKSTDLKKDEPTYVLSTFDNPTYLAGYPNDLIYENKKFSKSGDQFNLMQSCVPYATPQSTKSDILDQMCTTRPMEEFHNPFWGNCNLICYKQIDSSDSKSLPSPDLEDISRDCTGSRDFWKKALNEEAIELFLGKLHKQKADPINNGRNINFDDTCNTDTSSRSSKVDKVVRKLLSDHPTKANENKKLPEKKFKEGCKLVERGCLNIMETKSFFESSSILSNTEEKDSNNTTESDLGISKQSQKYMKDTSSLDLKMPEYKHKTNNCAKADDEFKKQRKKLSAQSHDSLASGATLRDRDVKQTKSEVQKVRPHFSLANWTMKEMKFSGIATEYSKTFDMSTVKSNKEKGMKEDTGEIDTLISSENKMFNKIDQIILQSNATNQKIQNVLRTLPKRLLVASDTQDFVKQCYKNSDKAPLKRLDMITNMICNVTSFREPEVHQYSTQCSPDINETITAQLGGTKSRKKRWQSMIPPKKEWTI